MHPILANIIVDYFLKGGPIMWPILVAFLAALIVVIERILWWWNLGRRTDVAAQEKSFDAIAAGDFVQALRLTNVESDPYLRTVHDGILHAHSSLLGAMQLRASEELKGGERLQWVL